MESMNELFNKSCKINYKFYKKITNNITLIDNFFEDFGKARDFFINREKWKCISYQEHSKPGYESIFPFWVGKSLMENISLDHSLNSYDIVCNFFYHDPNEYISSLSNSNYFPHIDNICNNGFLEYICLINLNNIPVSTKFYSYKNKECCDNNLKNKWDNYNKKIRDNLLKYYNKKNITRNEVKVFLNKQNLDIKLTNTIQYNSNQAIIYPANLFHSPNVTEEFTENNPRILLRITFYKKIEKIKGISYD